MSRNKVKQTTLIHSNFKESYNRAYYFGHDSDETLSFTCSKCKKAFTLNKSDLKPNGGVIGPVEKLVYGYICPYCGHLDAISYSDIRLCE